jgi:hypothetical protein
MEQRVFIEANEKIRTFIQLTYVTLSSTGAVPLRRLEEAYKAMTPTIHQGASSPEPDCGALSYAALRLPACTTRVKHVLLGQSESIFEESGVTMSAWTEVLAKARRRRYLHDGADTLICFIASKSDVDDIIPSLLALQIEWNKAHARLAGAELPERLPAASEDRLALVARLLGISSTDARKLETVFGKDLGSTLARMRTQPMDLYIRNFEASYCRYRRETETWWRQIQAACPDIGERPVYFVSSNTHSLINLLSGYAEAISDEIFAFAASDPELSGLVHSCLDHEGSPTLPPGAATRLAASVREARGEAALAHAGIHGEHCANSALLYYLLMKYEQQDTTGAVTARRLAWEEMTGVRRIAAEKTLDIPTQVVDLRILASSQAGGFWTDRFTALVGTDAMVLNIDYPLGRTAYFLLNKLAEHIDRIKGVYVIGKAASLFADRGDVIIPSSIIDQHTRNQYFFENCIRVADVEPYMDPGKHAIYDNQKAVTVLGTFLQNRDMLNAFLAAGVTDLEMEAGPYLAAMYEIARPKRYPEDETVSLRMPDMDLGIVHYVSDSPLSGRHLDRSLELDGIDATYAATSAVVDRILGRECGRL